jgi:hypothetical protein
MSKPSRPGFDPSPNSGGVVVVHRDKPDEYISLPVGHGWTNIADFLDIVELTALKAFPNNAEQVHEHLDTLRKAHAEGGNVMPEVFEYGLLLGGAGFADSYKDHVSQTNRDNAKYPRRRKAEPGSDLGKRAFNILDDYWKKDRNLWGAKAHLRRELSCSAEVAKRLVEQFAASQNIV